MGNIFLTGAVQAGKSTAIGRFLSANPALRIGGFVTRKLPAREDGAEEDVYILPPVWTEADLVPERRTARRSGGVWRLTPEAFDAEGCALLRRRGPFDLLLMDELGRMELPAAAFRAAVLAALDGGVPVLGVVKPESNPFLDAVRAHPRSAVLEVTAENREQIPGEIARRLGRP